MIPPDSKLAEDCLIESRQTEPNLSDSQATEVFVPSDDKIDNDISTTASSCSPVMQQSKKRVLPSWFSGEHVEIRGPKSARKTCSKKDASVEEDQKASTVGGDNVYLQTVRGEGKYKLVDVGASKTSSLKRQKSGEPGGAQASLFEAEKIPYKFRQRRISRRERRSTREQAVSSAKNVFSPSQKRQEWREDVENDLPQAEESDVPEDCEFSFEAKEDLALTTEDLVNLATEHLEMENITNEPVNQSADRTFNGELNKSADPALKKKGSIFSVQGWNDMANEGADLKDAAYSQEVMYIAPVFAGDPSEHHSGGIAGLTTDAPPLYGDPVEGLDSLGTADNVVDDMLGLIFGPNLSKTATSRLESSQNMVQDVDHSTVACSEAESHHVGLPVLNDSSLQPKKKGSLKDKVVLYLG